MKKITSRMFYLNLTNSMTKVSKNLLKFVLIGIFINYANLVLAADNTSAQKPYTTDGQTASVPLTQPNISQTMLLQWANTATIAAYSYNFATYKETFRKTSLYFTPDGWKAFLQALKDSNTLNAVLTKKLVVSAVATGSPVILDEGLKNGVYSWRVQMPILVTYQNATQSLQQKLVVTLLITRVPTSTSPQGVKIAEFVAARATTS